MGTNLVQVDSEEVEMLLCCELCRLHTQSDGGRRTTLLVAARIARDVQSWNSTHS